MLTKTDLTQIGKIVRDEVQGEISPIKKDVASLKQDMGGLKNDLGEVKSEVNQVKLEMRRGFKEVRKDLNTVINFFDHEHLELQDRVRQLELRSGFNL